MRAVPANDSFSQLVAVGALVVVPAALADAASEDALAGKYAPVVRLVDAARGVRPGRAVHPDRRRRALRRADRRVPRAVEPHRPRRRSARRRPTSSTATSTTSTSPATRSTPGCDYELWARRLTARDEPTVYAHVATDPGYPGKLALQYWFFYPFNDFNNTHEGDWEMTQLVFDAADRARGADEGSGRGRLQLARGRRARRLGRREARDRRRHAPGRLSGRGLAREQVHGGALPRELRRGRRRLRPHARAASRADARS